MAFHGHHCPGTPPEQGPLERNSKMHNLTVQAGMGHLVRLMLFNMEMEKGFKFSPKFKQLQVGATSSQQVENFFESKTSVFTVYFHFYFHLYVCFLTS